ncbi:MAG: phosphoenolpyruvate--protein phosphotransferase [Elusimicrobiaceae bacterium]|nr:phosphoenolpyruvate--protein phosphotransferase [Elusimicrobiaceae bacterium]
MTDFIVFAPTDGQLRPIEQVPDPAFAQKMLGDGLAIVPTSPYIVAPFDATVSNLHKSLHAITLKSGSVEILIHIGVESVSLKGKGFKALVAQCQSVKLGQKLIEFDPDFLAKNTPCNWVITVVTSPDGAVLNKTTLTQLTAAKDNLFSLVGIAGADVIPAEKTQTGDWVYSRPITISNENGLHARPAAALAQAAKKYPFAIELEYDGKTADAKSLVAVMGLAITQQAQVRLRANGLAQEANEALTQLADFLESGLGENPATSEDVPTSQPVCSPSQNGTFHGLTACAGIALGKTFLWQRTELAFEQNAKDPQTELTRLQQAVCEVIQELSAPSSAVADTILKAHKELLQDPFLLEQSEQFIQQGRSAPAAFNEAIRASIDVLKRTQNRFLMERMADLKDVRQRVLAKLTHVQAAKPDFPAGCIVIAEELLPSDIKEINQQVQGVVLAQGSPTAHASILLRNRGIPALVSVGADVLNIENGTQAILNASIGQFILHPSGQAWQQAEQLLQKEQQDTATARQTAHEKACTTDGVHIHVTGNASNVDEAQAASQNGADGLGLVRTEFLFRQRATAPTQTQQTDLYQKITDALQGYPVTLRTLDVGGDKPVSYMPIPAEENPIMGLRGVRNYDQYDEMFRTQIRAMLCVKPTGSARIMLPMISFLSELEKCKQIIEQEKKSLGISAPVQVGIMVEVPSAALLAQQFAAQADFFSIGTNDLTQYTLAIDRGHKTLCAQADPLHPAVLQLIASTCRGAQKHQKPVAVCGAVAGDLDAVPLLVGLGVTELAVSANLIAPVKALVRKISKAHAAQIAEQALQCTSANAVRTLVKKEFSK